MLTNTDIYPRSNFSWVKSRQILIPSVLLIVLLIFFYTNKTEDDSFSVDNPYNIINMALNKTVRQLSWDFFPFPISKEQYDIERKKQSIINSLIGKTFNGQWEATDDLTRKHFGETRKGKLHVRFSRAIEISTQDEAWAMSYKCFDGNFIDNWLLVNSFVKLAPLLSNISALNETANETWISLESTYITSFEKGEMFTSTFISPKTCNSKVNWIFPITKVNSTITNNRNIAYTSIYKSIDITSFTASVETNCGFNFHFNITYDNTKKIVDEINLYMYCNFFVSWVYMIANIQVSYQLSNNESNIEAISWTTISQNWIWHSYCLLSHISIALSHPNYIFQFCWISICYLIWFGIFDFRLIYIYWKIKGEIIANEIYIKQKITFYIVFYLFFFISFFILILCFYNRLLIAVICAMVWTPQIVRNVMKNNSRSYPWSYIIAITLDRVFIPFYFRWFDDNFFMIKTYKLFCLCWFGYLLFCILFMYLQVFIDPRFFLPFKFKEQKYDFYKTKKELVKIKPASETEECVICIRLIYDLESDFVQKTKKKEEQLLSTVNDSEIRDVNIIATNTSTEMWDKDTNVRINVDDSAEHEWNLYKTSNTTSTSLSTSCSFRSRLCFVCKVMFKFYKRTDNVNNKKYMITQCGHIFHTECWEPWWELKKECPNCRSTI